MQLVDVETEAEEPVTTGAALAGDSCRATLDSTSNGSFSVDGSLAEGAAEDGSAGDATLLTLAADGVETDESGELLPVRMAV